jgi:DNA-binding FrmR family transcriptional regulator
MGLAMAHTRRDKDKLLKRVNRIRGQVDALHKALEEERECSSVMQLLASCRGAFNGLMAEIVEGHVRCHVLGEEAKANSPQAQAADELIALIKSYLK